MAGVCLMTTTSTRAPAGSPGASTRQAAAASQATSSAKPLMSDQFFKNVQVLKGIPVDQFLGTMGFIAASLSVNCTECHSAGGRGSVRDYSADNPKKQKARQMML